ncbi:MAG: 4Fe-4S dicluster domain-containing protein [Hyphomicrobiaceae bacterium]|nr:4Fe-4S dicluster domain-containing protein [Hyphomicrobiaceae bacterium]
MTAPIPTSSRKYDLNFARWVRDNVEGGNKMNMCMQCGACSGSCPIGTEMKDGPRKIFMMVRAGMKEEVLDNSTLWNCTSCYRCVVRCPRGVPVTYILQGLAALSAKEGYAPKVSNNYFAKFFWMSTAKLGKTDERLVTTAYFFSFGLVEGVKRSLANLKIAFNMVKAGRMHIGLPHTIKDKKGLAAILEKAKEIEERS